MNKTLLIVIALILLVAGVYYYYTTQNLKSSYTVEEFDTTDAGTDDCNYNFAIEIDADKLKFKERTNLNATLWEGSATVSNGILNLSRQSMKTIPSEIAEQECIKAINLNRNYITEFPVSFFDIDKLQKLDLSENSITKFPSLKEESSIVSLKLTGNNISSVSGADLLKFKNLEHLYFKGNKGLKNLPQEITKLTKLKNLDLRKTAFAQDYGKVQKLQKAMPNTRIYYFSKN